MQTQFRQSLRPALVALSVLLLSACGGGGSGGGGSAAAGPTVNAFTAAVSAVIALSADAPADDPSTQISLASAADDTAQPEAVPTN